MPIDALRVIQVEQADKPFNRLAFRVTLNGTLNNNAVQNGSTIAIHATRYRKLRRTIDNADLVEVCGQDDAESGMTATWGDNSGNDDLLQALLRRCRNYFYPVGTSAKIELQWTWRRKQGDITSNFRMEVTPLPNGDPSVLATHDVEEMSATNPTFSDLIRSLLNAIKNRTDGMGW